MIIIHVMGGLGNQLYQYAMYEKLRLMGKEVKLDVSAYKDCTSEEKEWRKLELEWLEGLELEYCTLEERERLLDSNRSICNRIRRKLLGRNDKTIKEVQTYMPEIYEMDEVFLYGYWVCEKYYEDILEYLQKKIRFPRSLDERNQEVMMQMQKQESVSIHIRRTDYLAVADGARYMGICTDKYYATAIDYMKKNLDNPVFYIFSDDIEYVKKHYAGENVHIVDWNTGKNSMYDMQLMSMCKHNICANSTFSIWGARLNQNKEKKIIRPLKLDNYEKISVEEMRDNWAKWLLIDEEGKLV